MASLEKYILDAMPGGPHKPSRLFHDVPGRAPPTLARGRTNRILLYNGCFNPPHRGHLALLEQAFHHGGEDLHMIAAVVLVASDAYLRWKARGGVRDAVPLSVAQRVQLWQGALLEEKHEHTFSTSTSTSSWCLVHPEEDWWRVTQHLEAALERDGFAVEWVRVAGGDKVTRHIQAHGEWGCRTLITSDVCRPVDFFSPVSTGGGGGSGSTKTAPSPLPLRHHDPWRRVAVALDILWEQAWRNVMHVHLR